MRTVRLMGAQVDDGLMLAHRLAAAFGNAASAYGDNSAERSAADSIRVGSGIPRLEVGSACPLMSRCSVSCSG